MNLPDENQLLSREDFKRFVFLRARGRCIFCPAPAVDAHHVLERKLFEDGGYYLGNGAAVCDAHHWKCETTELSVDAVRAAAGIRSPTLPPGLDADKTYDKWGNELCEDGFREAGPLEYDDGMRRALQRGRVLHLLIPSDKA
ncbi:hypothetical protein WJ96_06915 [Burkholderia ubonensis]|uniref:HNH nuclease domain-containing protein n=1 Tax=Burkholderia ubonensis TaxID=101571 RepID=A0AAW3MWD7_9BURK|nr:hypothetical protein [Burkholderia ubonensis]KVP75435.1 hypothetical protein WJ93_08710 [Burkholderia ubonensis]KVP98248.1 hypothetical protein WJ96_06915 [Burkholderia ubonensis]KVZ92945.1 hypothetical protein WL25_18575 [Burkholderia ubonensis]